VGASERHYGKGGTEFIIGFDGSQALPICPSGKCNEECLRGYRTLVRTSLETHYLSATESSRLMLYKI
jgi:hypothetical protein